MKKWFSRIKSLDIRVDLFTLLLGLLLIWGYINYGGILFVKDSPILNIWANIATDLIGVWLTVRIVESLLQAREKFHSIRRTTVSNLRYFLRIAQEITPEFYEWRINSLQNELRWFEEKLPKRKKYLYRDEYDDIVKTIGSGRKLLQNVQSYMEIQHRLEDLEDDEIEKVVNQTNEKREKVIDFLNQIRQYRDQLKFNDSKDKFELEGFLNTINFQVLNNENCLDYFSKEDREIIEIFIQNISSVFKNLESVSIHDFTNLYSEIDFQCIDQFKYNKRINLYEIVEYKEVQRSYSRFRHRKNNHQLDKLSNILEIARKKYNSDEKNSLLSSTLGKYFDLVSQLTSLRLVVDDEVSSLEQFVENVKSNIWEESGSD